MNILVLVLLTGLMASSEACMCMPTHPQDYLCQDNTFVAVIKIRGHPSSVASISSMEFQGENSLYDRLIVTRHDETINRFEDQILPTAGPGEVVLPKEDSSTAVYLRYPIKFYQVFKGIIEDKSTPRKYYLYTRSPRMSCTAMKLSAKETYLVYGKIENGRLVISACEDPHITVWKSLSKTERRNIRGNLEDIGSVCESNCGVYLCPWANCKPQKQSECVWNKSMEKHYGGGKYNPSNFLCKRDNSGQCDWTGAEVAEIEKQARRKRHSKKNLRRRKSAQRKPAP